MSCRGNESSLLDCSYRGMRKHNCYRSNEVAVVCRAGKGQIKNLKLIGHNFISFLELPQRCDQLVEEPSLESAVVQK